MNLSKFFYFIGVIFIPIYIFPSGGVQLSDLFFFISLFLFLINGKRSLLFSELKYSSKLKYLRIFIFWTFIVNLIVFIDWMQTNTLLSSVYYVYNYLIMILTLAFFRLSGNSFLTKIYYSFFISIILVFLVAILNFDYLFADKYYFRRAVSFNNPNQLGYWALMSMTVLFILKKILSLNKVKYFNVIFALGILMTLYLSIISLSKASTISVIILIILNSVNNFKIMLFLSFVTIASFSYIQLEEDNFISRIDKRISDVGKANDDNLEGRNYDRLWKYPEYLFLGAGEGTIEQRFEKDNEIHSTIGTIIFSYGFFGTLSFLLFLFSCIRENKYSFLFFLIPLLLYSITHMGLRTKTFWIILILVIINNRIDKVYSNEKN
jgi:hypothetical protein